MQWPGMVVLLVTLIFWTREAEQALNDGKLKDMEERCTRNLMDIVTMVRGKLKSLQRATLGALVVTDVHARDVISNLVSENVSTASDFSWQVCMHARQRQCHTDGA